MSIKYFFDTEFIESSLQLLSIGIVCGDDGREYYSQITYTNPLAVDDWMARNVLPSLLHFNMGSFTRKCTPYGNELCRDEKCPWRKKERVVKEIESFIIPTQGEEIEIWGYYCAYDWVLFCQLFGGLLSLPPYFPHYCRDIKQECDRVGNPRLPPKNSSHNALGDAKYIKECWEFLQEKNT